MSLYKVQWRFLENGIVDTAGVMVEKSASVNSEGHQARGSVTVTGALDRLENWAAGNLTKCNKGKRQNLHLDWANHMCNHMYRLRCLDRKQLWRRGLGDCLQ